MKKTLPFLLILVIALVIAGCSASKAPPATATIEQPIIVTELPEATPETTPTATPAADLPDPALFDIPWDDRGIFEAGLIPSQRDALKELPGAGVYHIDFTVDDTLTDVVGKLEVRYTNTEDVALDEVIFRLFPNILGGEMTVDNVTINGDAAQTRLTDRDSTLHVALPAPMQPGDQVVIAMDYEVVVPVTPGSNYAILAYMENVLALAHAYPMIPAYDDQIGWYTEVPPNYGDVTYSDSAYYLVRATLPSDQVVQASGFQFDSQENDGQTTTTWVAGPMRDFYLVSSNNYQAVETKVGDTVVRSYAPAKLKEESKLALQFAVDALEVFNKFYGVYPFTEMDVAGTPTLAGGVEYPGIVVIALTLYDPNHPFFEVATAHEVGHQWFYSVVGNDQVHHPWLDESLTQYNTMLYFKEVHGQKGYEEERSDQESRWEYIDYADIPLDLPVKDYNEAEYSGIIYGRGGLFFDDLRKKIGDEAFETFQKNYYDTYKWGIATTDGLKQVAEDACGCDLTSMFEEWVYPK